MRLRRATQRSTASTATQQVAETATPAEVPCTPCEAARKARQFSLNPPAAPMLADDAVPTIAGAVSTDVGDAGVQLAVEGQERSFALNATAALIWLTIDGKLDVRGIIADLATETGASPDQIDPDVRGSIATFVDQGLVTLTPSS